MLLQKKIKHELQLNHPTFCHFFAHGWYLENILVAEMLPYIGVIYLNACLPKQGNHRLLTCFLRNPMVKVIDLSLLVKLLHSVSFKAV